MGKYFTIEELCRSSMAEAEGIDNTPDEYAVANMNAMIDNLLDPARRLFMRHIYVSSGYRSEALNKAVGGSPCSHHLRGMAADIHGGTAWDNRLLMEVIRRSGLRYTQLISEKPDRMGNPSWVHVSYDPDDLRMQNLTIR